MIKLIYKVCKNFTLHEVDQKKTIIADNDQLIKGSHFAIGEEFVDYTAPGETITDITQLLIDEDYLKLDREVNMR